MANCGQGCPPCVMVGLQPAPKDGNDLISLVREDQAARVADRLSRSATPMTRSFVVLAIAVAVVGSIAIVFWPHAQAEVCMATAPCRPAYANSVVCESLPLGTTRKELYVRLGQPTRISGNTLFFQASATESREPAVELDSRGNAKVFFCRGKP